MNYHIFDNSVVIRLDRGDEILKSIHELCRKEDIRLAMVTGLGAVDYVAAGLYNVEKQEYKSNVYTGEREIVALTGNVTTKDGEIYLHFHIAVSDENGAVVGGHLKEAIISATGEIILTRIQGTVERKVDSSVGLNILKFID